LSKGECQPDPESIAATAADTVNINLSVDDRRRRSTTSTIVNAPARNNRGIDQDKAVTTATATGSLLQKPVTLAAANLGSYDRNPGKADTTMNTGAIFGKKEAAQRDSIREATVQKAVGAASGRPRGNIKKKWKIFGKVEKFSSTRSIYLGQN
jgi:hypothetical protein